MAMRRGKKYFMKMRNKNNKVQIMKYLFFLLFLTINCQLSTVNRLYGYTYRGSFLQLGDEIIGLTAASAAEGGAGIAEIDEPSNIFFNPAGIFSARGELSLTSGVVSTYERRVHNDTDATTVSNSNLFFDFSGVAASYPVIKDTLSLSFGESVMGDFNFFYKEDVNSTTQIIGTNKIDSEGTLNRFGGGVSVNPVKSLLIGLSAYNLFGSPEQVVSSTTYGTKGVVINSISTTTAHSFSGTFFVLGGTYHVGDKTVFGLSYRPQIEVEDSIKENVSKLNAAVTALPNVKNRYKYPDMLSLGFMFRFPGPSEPTFYIDFIHTNWSSARIKSGTSPWTDCLWSDTLSWRLGAEHLIRDKKFRYGVAFLPDYSRKGSQRVAVSCGLGFNVWIIDLDVSAQYIMRRNTLEDRIFNVEEDAGLPRINLVTIDDYAKRFLVTGKIKW